MQCPNCGAPLVSGDAFCASCGADVRSVVSQPPPVAQPTQPIAAPPAGAVPPPPAVGQPAPPPMPPREQVAPTQVMPVAQPAPPPFPPGGPQPSGAAPGAPGAKKGLSAGAIVAITLGSVFGVLLLAGAGYFGYRTFVAKPAPMPATQAEKPATAKTEEPKPAEQPAEQTPAEQTPAASGGEQEYVVVTDAEARDVVSKFIGMRIAGDIEGSKALCSQNMLTGENGEFVKDKYWHPDSFKIVKTTPDQMYIHVGTMGQWPSGEEPTIYSVWRDPESGKVVIDGMLPAEDFPDLVQ